MDLGDLLNIPGLPNAGVVTLPIGAGGPGGNGPPAAINAIMNQLNALLGPGGPQPAFAGPPNQPAANGNAPNPPSTLTGTGTSQIPPTNPAPPPISYLTVPSATLNQTSTETEAGEWVNDVD